MRAIMVLNAKGGCGKTTIATNLAGYYAANDHRVALADLDPQASSTDWLAVRPADRPRIRGLPVHDGRHHKVPAGTDILVMDAPARAHDKMLINMVRRAQTIIVPVIPSALDARAAERFLAELGGLRKVVTTNVKIAVIANRVRERSRSANELEDYLHALRLPNGKKLPFLTMLRSSRNYLHAASRGLSVFEFAPMATVQDREEWAPLLRWLDGPLSISD